MSFFKPKYTVQSVAKMIVDGVRDGDVVLPDQHWYDEDDCEDVTDQRSSEQNGAMVAESAIQAKAKSED